MSNAQTGSFTAPFVGLSGRGTFYIRHKLTGGTYPANGNGIQDTVTVTFQ
ncbi:MAG: hypothetical protein LBQ81_03805 [Zoogloeaceae bacterium]|jgi:hypothetical protein|nr:hypothetical protein [Zoogloeaceae bacterium]